MDYINSSYCALTQYLMSSLGLWPYQSLWSRVFFLTLGNALMVWFFVIQGATIFTTKITTAYIIDLLPPLITCVLAILLFADRYANIGTMKQLLDTINNDWNSITTEEEIAIMFRYADIAKRLNIIYACKTSEFLKLCEQTTDQEIVALLPSAKQTLIIILIPFLLISLITLKPYAFAAYGIYAASLFTSQVLDIILPLNETRPKEYPFSLETMIDDDKYFNVVLIGLIATMLVILIAIVANQILFMLYIHHVCAMFTVLGYRMDKILQEKDLTKECSTLCRYSNVYQNIAICVEDHLKTIRYANKIDSCYGLYYLIILIGGAIVASLFLVIVLSFSSGSTHYLRSAGFLIGQTIHMFLNSYMGQKLTNKSLSISQIIYNSKWHFQTPSVQKLLLLIMLKSSKPCIVSVFGLFVLSFECFSTGVQTVVSYCMVIKQFQ